MKKLSAAFFTISLSLAAIGFVFPQQSVSYIIVHSLNPEGIEIASIQGMEWEDRVKIYDGDYFIGYGAHDAATYNQPIAISAGIHKIKAVFNGISMEQNTNISEGETKILTFRFTRTSIDSNYLFDFPEVTDTNERVMHNENLVHIVYLESNPQILSGSNHANIFFPTQYPATITLTIEGRFSCSSTSCNVSGKATTRIASTAPEGWMKPVIIGAITIVHGNTKKSITISSTTAFNRWYLQNYSTRASEGSAYIAQGTDSYAVISKGQIGYTLMSLGASARWDRFGVGADGVGKEETGSWKDSFSWEDSASRYIPGDTLKMSSVPYDLTGTGISGGSNQAVHPNRPLDSTNGQFYSDPQNSVGEPINSITGNMYIITPDLTLSGKGLNFSFTRTYNSQAASASSETGPLGYGGTHSYNLYLTQDTQNKLVKIKDDEGKGYLFADNQDGTFISQRGEYSTLTKNSPNFIWRKKDGRQYLFDLSGKLTQIKDRNSNSINLSYNNQNQLTSITDTCGRQLNLTYAQGKLSLLTDPSGRTVSYSYDAQGNLITATDPLGNSTTYSYDSKHNLTKKTDPLNQSIYYTYDSLNRCTSSSGENNAGRVDLVFDPANHQTTITDSRGNSTTHYYNDDSLITKVKDAQGNETASNWDSNFNLVYRTDALGRATTMEYDASGNLTKVTDPSNNITFFTYEPNFNLLLTSTDAQGNLTSYTRDTSGNPTKVTDSYNNSTNYTYNSAGQVTSAQNALGGFTNFTYDNQGNLTQTKDALNNLNTLSYDSIGNLLQSKDALSNITKFTYDKLNQLTKVVYPDDSSVSYAYDSSGNRTSVTDALGNTTSYTFDQLHHLTSTTDSLSNTIDYAYDTEGNLISLTDQNNNQTTYTYDSLNRLVSETDALANKKQYQYDVVGNRTVYIDAKGQTTAYEYDKLNRLTKITYPDRTVSYTYDSLGRRISMTDTQGTTNYSYDKLGRLLQVDGPKDNDTISYTYDSLANRFSMTGPNNKTTSYTYDALNRLTSITDPQAKVTSYIYDSLGNLTSLTYPNATKTTCTYDSLNRLLKLTEQQSISPYTNLAEFSYTYDKLSRRTQINLLDASQINYTYDTIGQLTNETKTSSTNPYQISYTYDPSGNRTKMTSQGIERTYSYNSLNQLTEESFTGSNNSTKITVSGRASDASGIRQVTVNDITAVLVGNNFTCAGVTFTPGPNTLTVTATDQAGNSTTKIIHVTYSPTTKLIYTYDQNGNLISKTGLGDTLNLSYDSTNRLTRFKNQTLEETYQYDGEGKRISKQSGSSSVSYLYDGLNVIQENSSSSVTNYTRNPNSQGGIGGIVSQLSSSNIPTYYHYDGLGSVTNLTNSIGANTQTYTYDAFGNTITQAGSTANPNKFLTKETDASGLIYFGARYYDPKIGRFVTQDPSGMTDGPNLYLYCLNNPINAVDPFGLDTYYVNYELFKSEPNPTNAHFSHSYIVTTDNGKVTDTYSWGNDWQNRWFHNDPVDMAVAQRAVDSNKGVQRYGGEELDLFVDQAYKIRDSRRPYDPLINNCKENAANLLNEAKKLQNIDTQRRERRCAAN